MQNTKEQKTYLFFRKEHFYLIEMRDDADAIANAKHNPGTIKVEDINGRVVWELNKTEE